MSLHDFSGLIWAVFIVVAVISSVLRSARRAGAPARQAEPQRPPSAVQRMLAPAPPPAPRSTPRVVPSALVLSISTTAPSPRRETPLPAPIVSTSPRNGARARSIFDRGSPIARGIVALEVLGPPRALRGWTAIV